MESSIDSKQRTLSRFKFFKRKKWAKQEVKNTPLSLDSYDLVHLSAISGSSYSWNCRSKVEFSNSCVNPQINDLFNECFKECSLTKCEANALTCNSIWMILKSLQFYSVNKSDEDLIITLKCLKILVAELKAKEEYGKQSDIASDTKIQIKKGFETQELEQSIGSVYNRKPNINLYDYTSNNSDLDEIIKELNDKLLNVQINNSTIL